MKSISNFVCRNSKFFSIMYLNEKIIYLYIFFIKEFIIIKFKYLYNLLFTKDMIGLNILKMGEIFCLFPFSILKAQNQKKKL